MGADSVVDSVETYCEFGDKRVYLLLAITRSKENEGTDTDMSPVVRKVVARPDEISRRVDELRNAVRDDDRRFRLYLSVNARNVLDAVFSLRRDMDEWLEMLVRGNESVMRKFERVDSEFKSTLQSDDCKDDSKLLFDLDGVGEDDFGEFERQLDGVTSVELTRRTPNGYHVVTAPFNYTEFTAPVEYELKTDGLVFLSYVGEDDD